MIENKFECPFVIIHFSIRFQVKISFVINANCIIKYINQTVNKRKFTVFAFSEK